jgi:hypothetical protein
MMDIIDTIKKKRHCFRATRHYATISPAVEGGWREKVGYC